MTESFECDRVLVLEGLFGSAIAFSFERFVWECDRVFGEVVGIAIAF
jgi:hypothetical protein